MTFAVRVYDKNNNAVLAPVDVTLQPERWSAAAMGGPVAAEISLSGSVDGMLALAAWLGYRVEIVSDGTVVWFGEIDTVSVAAGGKERTLTLGGMANRAKVLYTAAMAGGGVEATETEWQDDAASVARYGRREMVHSARGTLTAAQATAQRARLIDALKEPQRQSEFTSGNEASGTVVCRGYWARLGDVYYQQMAGLETHNPGSGTAIPLGLGFSSAYLAFVNAEPPQLHEVFGKLKLLGGYEALRFVVAGTAENDNLYEVASGDSRDAVAYTSLINFEPNDDLYDEGSATGLEFIATDDIIWVQGSAYNDGARRVKTSGGRHIEVSPGWNSGYNSETGGTATIYRGTKITVIPHIDPNVLNEAPNGVIVESVTAYGQRIYQSFALAIDTTWTLAAVELRVRKVGNPADALRVGLYTDSSGTPGALLEQVTIDGSALTDEITWVALNFSNAVALAYGSTYGLLIDRTGSMSATDFYEVEIDDAGGYARGALRLHDGTTYQAGTGDLIFRCLGAVDTVRQVQSVLTGISVDGITAALVETESGIDAWQYRAENETAAAIVDDLLAQGTSDGQRLLATVMNGGLARVFVQPVAGQRLWVWRDGTLQTATGAPALPGWLPVGIWVHDDILLQGAWSGLNPQFVEKASYQIGSGWSLEAENQQNLSDMLGVAQG
jgi:hypothetical protein